MPRSPGTSTRRTISTTCAGSASADDDFRDGGSDVLVDALVAAGDADAIAERCRAHREAGATQVAVHPLEEGDPFGRETLARLAPVLLELP